MTTHENKILTTTANELMGYQVICQLGIVQGIVVRSPHMAQGILGGFKMLMGGRNQAYIQICERARAEALNALIKQAVERGANALLAVRYDTTLFFQGITEIVAYGTAVIVRPTSISS